MTSQRRSLSYTDERVTVTKGREWTQANCQMTFTPGTIYLSTCFLVFKVTQRTLLVKKTLFYLQNQTPATVCILLFSDNLWPNCHCTLWQPVWREGRAVEDQGADADNSSEPHWPLVFTHSALVFYTGESKSAL